MTVAPSRTLALRLAAAVLVVPLVAACGGGAAATPTASASPLETAPPPVPSYTLGPAPSGCPTTAPPPMAADQTATVTLHTNFGDIVVKVEGKLGPNAAGDFVALARCGYYDNVILHRIVPGFVIQGGDGEYARLPLTQANMDKMGQGGPGYTIPDDKVTTKYVRGTVAMARTSAANSAGSQFFIVLSDSAQSSLGASGANNYAIFGTVTSGMSVVDRIAEIPTGGAYDPTTATHGDMALQPAPILSATVTTP